MLILMKKQILVSCDAAKNYHIHKKQIIIINVSSCQQKSSRVALLSTLISIVKDNSCCNTSSILIANGREYKNWVGTVIDKETRNENIYCMWKRKSTFKECANCCDGTRILKKLLKCKKCAKTFYCSKKCQKKHWLNGHSRNCKPNWCFTMFNL